MFMSNVSPTLETHTHLHIYMHTHSHTTSMLTQLHSWTSLAPAPFPPSPHPPSLQDLFPTASCHRWPVPLQPPGRACGWGGGDHPGGWTWCRALLPAGKTPWQSTGGLIKPLMNDCGSAVLWFW